MAMSKLDAGCLKPHKTWLRKAGAYALALLVLMSLLQASLASRFQSTHALQAQVLRVGLLEDSPPYDYYNADNELVGLNVDLIREAARRMDRRVEITVIPYNRVMMGLLFGHYDVVAAPQSVSPYRRTVVRFAEPYLQSGDILVYQAGRLPVDSLEDIRVRKLKVAAFNGTSYPQFLEKQGLADQMVVYPTQREMFMAFLNGKVDVMLMDEHIARYYRDREGFPFAFSRQAVRSDKTMAFSTRKESEALGKALDAALADMAADGTLTRIKARWLGGEGRS